MQVDGVAQAQAGSNAAHSSSAAGGAVKFTPGARTSKSCRGCFSLFVVAGNGIRLSYFPNSCEEARPSGRVRDGRVKISLFMATCNIFVH